ncbi:hypothetical protein [Halocynthiibacter namhaensis]|uniref:hypothetical protein n=1 Tax=Halocynthiibacter namhaensis TaxID=1290553 RepID=UPI0012E07F40|nr:hypothetical protein [Halocynthiibacter namhaensis]
MGAAGENLSAIKNCGQTLADAIDRYTTESVKEVGRTKAQILRPICEYDIAGMECADIQSHDFVAFAKEINTNRAPSTVGNYLSHLGAVFALARPAWGMELEQQAMKDAFVVCNRLSITGKARSRDRRPTLRELDALLTLPRIYGNHGAFGGVSMQKGAQWAPQLSLWTAFRGVLAPTS